MLAAPILCKLNVFISHVMCVLCRSAGVLSHTLHLAVSSREAEQSNPLFFLSSSFTFFSSPVAPADKTTPGSCGSMHAQLTGDAALQLSKSLICFSDSLSLSFPIILSSLSPADAGCFARRPLFTSFKFLLMGASTHSPKASSSFPPFLSPALLLLSPSHCVASSLSHPPLYSRVHLL